MHFPIYSDYVRYSKLAVLYLKVRAGIGKRVKFSSQEDLDSVALWAISTHFHRVFEHFPILDFVKAGYDAGGSVAMKTVLSYCSRPYLLQSPTPAALFRLADDLRPTLGIEEYTTNLDESIRNGISQLLDGSFDLKVLTPRVENFRVEGYDFYGPRAVVDPEGLLSQYSTASRALDIALVNSPGFQSSADDIISEDFEVIQTLYDSFIIYADGVRKAYKNCSITGSGRLDQAFRPLLAIALVLKGEGVDVVDSLITKIRRKAENLILTKVEGDITKQIFAAIREFVSNEQFNGTWIRTRNDGEKYIRLSQLKNLLSNSMGVEFQSDTSKQGGTRYWRRPSKDVAELLQDAKRFAGLMKAFLPDFIGQKEPASRHVCLYFNDVGLLVERLNSLIGDDLKNDETHKIPHVGFTMEPIFSYIINKNNNKIPQNRKYKVENKSNRQKTPHNTVFKRKTSSAKNKTHAQIPLDAYFHFVGFDTFFDVKTLNNTTFTSNPTTSSTKDDGNSESHYDPPNSDTQTNFSTSKGVEEKPQVVEISPEIREKALKKLNLLPDDSYKAVWSKLNVLNFLSEILTKDQSKKVIMELKREGKITEDKNSFRRVVLFYKSLTEYTGKCRESFD
ncbi:hypothetical protein ACLIKE_02925, partial [Ferroplasma acidiphilum]